MTNPNEPTEDTETALRQISYAESEAKNAAYGAKAAPTRDYENLKKRLLSVPIPRTIEAVAAITALEAERAAKDAEIERLTKERHELILTLNSHIGMAVREKSRAQSAEAALAKMREAVCHFLNARKNGLAIDVTKAIDALRSLTKAKGGEP